MTNYQSQVLWTARAAMLLVVLIASARLLAQTDIRRPRILGIAHMAVYVSDLGATRGFYEKLLGFEEPFSLKRSDGTDRIAFIKINDQQYIELFAEPTKNDGQLNHIALYTDDAAGMRDYLASRGVKVPEKVGRGRTGNYNFTITDPDGHTVEFVQYTPESWMMRDQGKFMPANAVSKRIKHVGFIVGSLPAAMKFYGELLGFREFWRGSSTGNELSWVNMRVPDGEDYVEFMLYRQRPSGAQLGEKNHASLEVPDVPGAVALLNSRPARNTYRRDIEVRVGKNRKRQANLFDPDGTRIELMEPATVDGKLVPSSTAPPPQ